MNIKATYYLCLFTLIVNLANAQNTKKVFNRPASGNGGDTVYVIPACVTSITVQVWGGSGAGASGSASNSGGGGGGGGYSMSVISVTPGSTYTLHVGNYGTPTGTATAGSGGDSWFGSASTLMAKGGAGGNTGGNGGLGGDKAAGIGQTTYSGGNGGNYFNAANSGGGGGGSTGYSINDGLNGAAGTASAGGAGAIGENGNGGNGGGNGQTGTNNFSCYACGGGGGAGYNGGQGGAGSSGMVVIILPDPVNAVVTAPQTVCPGNSPATFTVNATGGQGGAYAYVWQISTTSAISGFSTVSGETNSTYSLGAANATTWVRSIVSIGSCTPDTSNVIQVTVANLSGTVSFPQTICTNSTPSPLSTTINPNDPNASYVWQSSTTSSTSGFTNIGGATASTYVPGAQAATTWYRTVVSSAGCTTNTTAAVGVTSTTAAAVVNAGGTSTIFQDSPLLLTGSSVSGSVSTAAWSITNSNPAGTHQLSNTAQTANPTSVIFTPQMGFTGTVTLTLTGNANGCGGAKTSTKTVIIIPPGVQNPGGVPSELWVRAEKEVYINAGTTLATDGQTIQQWNDQKKATIQNILNNEGAPTYLNAPGKFLNFNPQVRVRGDQDRLGSNNNSIWNPSAQTMCIVHTPNGINAISTICGFGTPMEGPGWYFNGGTIQMTSTPFATWQSAPNNGLAVGRPFILLASYSGSGNNVSAINQTNNGQGQTSGALTISTAGSDNNFYFGDDSNYPDNGGLYSEVIIFKTALINSELQRVNSYLAIKYGITLYGNATTSNPGVVDGEYVYNGGTRVWSYTGYATYHNEVTGIGRDDQSALYQKVSRSSFNTTNDAVIISTDNDFTSGNYNPLRGTPLQDGQALLFGNDKGSTTTTETTDLDNVTYLRRMIREYKVENTGAVSNVNLYFESLPTLNAGEFYEVLSDADGNFTTGSTAIGASSTKTFTNITCPNGISYLTVAIAKLTVEFELATANSPENVGGNIPRLLIKGPVVNNVATTITINDLGTGTATANVDYSLFPAVVTIPPGVYDGTSATSIPIALNIIDDCFLEPNETINLQLGTTTGYVVVGDANNNSTTQNNHTYTINNDDIPTTATITGATMVCQNATPPTITFTGGSGTAPYYFTYSIDGGPTYSLSAVSAATTTVSTTTAGTHTVSLLTVADAKTYSTSCVVTLTTTATVLVNPLPAINPMTAASCAGASFTSTPVNVTDGLVPAGTTYTWGLPTVTGGATGASTGTNQNNITQTLNNPTNAVQTATYSVTPTSGAGCVGAPYILTASLSAPVTIFDTTMATICSGNAFSLTPTTGIPAGKGNFVSAGTTYNWAAPTLTGGMTGGSAQTNQTLISQTLVNPTTVQQTATYTVTPYSGGCPSPAFKISIPVNPSPTGTIAGTSTVCFGATAINVTFTGITGNAPYTFTYSLNGATTTVTSSGTTTTVAVPTNPATTLTYSLLSVADNLCSQPQSGSAIVTVNPLPTATIGSDVTVCQNSAGPLITFTGAGGSNPYTFNYTINGGAIQTVTGNAGVNTATVAALTNVVNNFTYALTNVKEGSAAGCSQAQTNSTTVVVRAPSQGTVTSSATRVCQNSTPLPNMVFNGSIGTAPYVFYYSTNIAVGGSTTHSVLSTGSTATVPVPTGVADTLVYTITGIQDASGIICGIGGSFDSLIVDPLPKSTITSPGGPNQCYNPAGTVELDFTAVNVVGQITFNYTEQFGATYPLALAAAKTTPANSPLGPITVGSHTLLDTSIFVSAGQVGTTIYSNGISSSNVCAGSGSGTYTITVNPLPTATVSMNGASTICDNLTTKVRFTAGAGQPPFKFTYNINNGASKQISTPAGTYTVDLTIDTVPGTYTVNLTAVSDQYNCNQAQTSSVTVTVLPNDFITLTSAPGSPNQSICVNTLLTPITYSLSGGATGATVSPALPSGVSSSFLGSVFTISGTPTAVSTQTAISTYTISTNGTCIQASASGTITVNPDATIALTSVGNNIQSLCVNNAIMPITYSVSGGASSAIVTALPAGISGSFAVASGVFTISGTPTAVSTQTLSTSYTVTTIGTCKQTALTGTIIVYPDAKIALTPGSGSNVQAVCVNTGITAITYTISGGATSATVTGLPLGLSGSINNGVFTISGTPTTVSTLTVTSPYTVSTGGSCVQTSAAGTITVYPDATLALTSAPGTTAQTVCVRGTSIAPITYTLGGGAYSASVAGLPNGVSTSYAPATGVLTISGTPTIVSTQTVVNTYTVSTNGSACVQQQLTGTIQMDPLPTAYAGSVLPICETDSVTILNAVATDGTIKWTTSNGQGVLTNTTTPTPQYKASTLDQNQNIILTMTVTSTNNCNVKPETASSSVTIFVRPTLIAVPTVTTSVCQNSPATLVFTVTSPGTAPYIFTYTETVNGVVNSTTTTANASKTATISVPTGAVGKVVYSLTQVQDNNCTKALSVPTQTVIVNPLPYATISQDEDVCRDSTAQKIKIKGSKGATPYTFAFNINNVPTSMTAADSVLLKPPTDKVTTMVYTLTQVKDANNCIQSLNDKVTVVVHENPNAIFTVSPERTSILEPEVSISDASISTNVWMWDFGDGSLSSSPSPESHTYADTGTYKIKLKVNNSLCKDSTSILVRITLPTSLYVPAAFSPNGDGINDIFKAEGDGITKFEMLIFDRWGQLVFQSNDINKGWDGKVNGGSSASQIDAFVYVINIRALANKHDYTYRGVVNIMK
jgi:gliding motility-associated-like protein